MIDDTRPPFLAKFDKHPGDEVTARLAS